MKIGIYGGSFNPIHKGHIKIAEYAIKNLGLDKLIFVPAYKSPFKKSEVYEDASYRKEMIEISIGDKMTISDFEINRKGSSYTIETVKYFKHKYKDDELFLIIGTDQLYKLHKWRDIKTIASTTKIVVFKREKAFSKINIKRYNCLLLSNPLFEESSSKFRAGDFSNVSLEVAKYIGKNHLYIKDMLRAELVPHKSKTAMERYKHCIATANAAAKYAKQIGFDSKRAWVAGAFHDITKFWPKEKHEEFLKRYKQEVVEEFKLHSHSGALWLENIYMINDPEIVNAVKVHTTLSDDLKPLDKIIYAADKLAMGRKHKNVQKEREIIRKDFEKGFTNLVKGTYDFIIESGKDLSKESQEIFERIINDRDNSSR